MRILSLVRPLATLALSLALGSAALAQVAAPKSPKNPAAPKATPAGPERWEKEIATYEKQDARLRPQPGGIVFTGSSSIRLWSTLGSDFPGLHVLNRGIGGSIIADHLVHWKRLVLPYQPRQVVFYCGTNDLARNFTPARVAGDFQKYVTLVHEALPQAKISYIALSPNPKRWKLIKQIRETNARIQKFCAAHPEYLEFINTFDAMLGADGQPLPDIFRDDQLHMNAKGYAIWTNIVAGHLTPEPAKK